MKDNVRILQGYSKSQTKKILLARNLEDPEALLQAERVLINKRKHVIDIPKPFSPVILLVSGGLDSTIIWNYLFKKYKLVVYPILFNRGQRRWKYEEAAVNYYSQYYKSMYPDLWRPVKKMDAFIPPREIRFPITIASNEIVKKNGQWRGIPLYSQMLFAYAVQYGYYLEIVEKIDCRTVFAGFMRQDGLAMKDETLTSVRVANLSACYITGDFRWQFIPLAIEKELGYFYDKCDFIKWASVNNLPLDMTRSCIRWGKHHCGSCISCNNRKEHFRLAGVNDPTHYVDSSLSKNIKSKIKKLFQKY